ncbi:MAG: FHA domain-containing protein [Oscillospiraceae bacterium]
MSYIQCENGHFYDSAKNSACPYCGASANGQKDNSSFGFGAPAMPELGERAVNPQQYGGAGHWQNAQQPIYGGNRERTLPANIDMELTIGGIETQEHRVNPVVGWLICIEGEAKGQDYRLVSGRNFIGRGDNMQVRIKGDNGISRDRHAIVTYDPVENFFVTSPGESNQLFYLNGNVVLHSCRMQVNDILTIGNSKLMLITCCNDRFSWENKERPE